MKPQQLIEMCDRAIDRWENPPPGKAQLPGRPMISFVWPQGKALPPDFLGVPYECHSARRGTVIWIDARTVKQRVEYALAEGFGK